MIRKFIAYDTDELEKKNVLNQASVLFESKIIGKDQFDKINVEFVSKIFTPSILMMAVFFILTLIGLLTLMFPVFLVFQRNYQLGMLLTGAASLFFAETVLIRGLHHYKTGITEALIYTGLCFIYFGLIGFNIDDTKIMALLGLVLAAFAAIRYLDLLALICTFGFSIWLLFQILLEFGGYTQAFLPFIFMTLFITIYRFSRRIQQKTAGIFLTEQFSLIQIISLLMFYLAGNYFVVRELSVNMLNLTLSDSGDIPFAFVFYALTALVPLFYIYRGIKKRSVLLIRSGLLTVVLSVITFKYYFSLGMPVVTVTVAGAVLIILSLLLLNYLKQPRNGFTREKLLQSEWNSPDLIAFIASQTLGGNQMSQDHGDDFTGGQGGEFGGGGADGKW